MSPRRFSLLLLDPGEHHLSDYSSSFRLHPADQSISGWLHVCSHSLVLEPLEAASPVTRILLRDVQRVANASRHSDQAFALQVDQWTRCWPNRPFETRQTDARSSTVRVSLAFSSADAAVKTIERLWKIHRSGSAAVRETMLERFVQEREKASQFDSGWLVDHREMPRIREPVFGYWIAPLARVSGWMQITDKRMYFQPVSGVLGEPVKAFDLASIRQVLRRRFELRNVAIEVFFKKRDARKKRDSSVFFAFENNQVRELVFHALKESGTQASLGEEKNTLLEVQNLWRRNQITNFEYLMLLNQFAGRSLQDLTQYPVFPWVLSDYTSQTIDLNDASIYRDLSKPIGAMNESRLKEFKDRMSSVKELKDPRMKFLYGTHYSTPGYVVSFLVRIHPDYMLSLQNGKFDDPDRLFCSISESWNSCQNNPADVRELIPEFYGWAEENFHEGDFLINSKNVQLGTRQNGMPVHDVVLPPWAKDAKHFIRIMSQALESEFVSQNLHLWIDLIFGYKNSGKEAELSDNLFYYLTYEGAIDIEKVGNPEERRSIKAQINEFGQTPSQIFKEPHPTRKLLGVSVQESFVETLESNQLTKIYKFDKCMNGAYGKTLHRNPLSDSDLRTLFPGLNPLDLENYKLPSSIKHGKEINTLIDTFLSSIRSISKKKMSLTEEEIRLETSLSSMMADVDAKETENEMKMLDLNSAKQEMRNTSSKLKNQIEDTKALTARLKESIASKRTLRDKINNQIIHMKDKLQNPSHPFIHLEKIGFVHTPVEVIQCICKFLSLDCIVHLLQTCVTWRNALDRSGIWKIHLKTKGYAVEDHFKWFHDHYLFGMLSQESGNSCTLHIEHGAVPNSQASCSNYLKSASATDQELSKSHSQSKSWVAIDICSRKTRSLEKELDLCFKSLNMHRQMVSIENEARALQEKINDAKVETKTMTREIIENDKIIREISKLIEPVRQQTTSDRKTKDLLRKQLDELLLTLEKSIMERDTMGEIDTQRRVENVVQIQSLQTRMNDLKDNLEPSKQKLRRELVFLAQFVKKFREDYSIIQKITQESCDVLENLTQTLNQ